VLLLGVAAAAASAGQRSETAVAVPSGSPDDAPPPPVAPAVINRNAAGRATVRAVQVDFPVRIDGRLDESIYTTTPGMSDFLQQEPREGLPATEKTEVWLFYDASSVYVTFKNWESRPDLMVMNEMRRDNNNVFQNDNVAIMFDTLNDRNGIELAVTPVGGRWDGQLTNERTFSSDWNPVWNVAVGRFDDGWTVEMAIPFKSLRYQAGSEQNWRFNARRINRWKNETSFLTRVPASVTLRGLWISSLAAGVVGLRVPSASRNVDIKPYAVSGLSSDLRATPTVRNDASGDVGVDARYSLTQNVIADFTYNTDFAQVEADEQQVNLTRFSLFFPEKREFFLENAGLFSFGGVGTGTPGDTPILFYSRRIGLNGGQSVPITGGGRLTGRIGRTSFGMMNVESGDDRVSGAVDTNFTVARVRRDILRRSSIGALATNRSRLQDGTGSNQAYGLDATFAFFTNLTAAAYWAQTAGSAGRTANSYRAQLEYAGDRYGLQLEQLGIGRGFNPDVGFVRREDIRRSAGQVRFSPRPGTAVPAVRKFVWTGTGTYLENNVGEVQGRDWRGEFAVELQNSDRLYVNYGGTYELIPSLVRILGVPIPRGGYQFESTRAGITFGQQRVISGAFAFETGDFYGGRRTSLSATQGRVTFGPRASVEPTWQGNWVTHGSDTATIHLAGGRVVYTMRPTMFATALIQYNTGISAVSANVRLRWEYRPGSELFVVYNEQRDTIATPLPDVMARSLVVKVTRLFRF
jgi:hypothetical protein